MFTAATYTFLADLRDHNSKEWFDANRARYEADAKAPLAAFVDAVRPHLAELSPHFTADSRSIFRIFRDTRFSKDKSPYKTHLAAQFRHTAAKGPMNEAVHAPGFYVHFALDGGGELEGNFGGAGLWRPEGEALHAIRRRIDREPAVWLAARAGQVLDGESLKKVPAGFPPDHAMAEDLRRKDFISTVTYSREQVLAADFVDRYVAGLHAAAPLVRFLCGAIGLPF